MPYAKVSILCAATLLSACRTLPAPGREAPATFADAAASSADLPLREALGLRLGAYLVRRLGRELDPADQALHDAAAARALWSRTKGYGENWRAPAGQVSGTIVPTSRIERMGPALCQQFHDSLRLPGEAIFGVDGTACLNGQDWTVDF